MDGRASGILLPKAVQVHRRVMHLPGAFHRRAETIRHAEQYPVSIHELGAARTGTEPVLNRCQHRLQPH